MNGDESHVIKFGKLRKSLDYTMRFTKDGVLRIYSPAKENTSYLKVAMHGLDLNFIPLPQITNSPGKVEVPEKAELPKKVEVPGKVEVPEKVELSEKVEVPEKVVLTANDSQNDTFLYDSDEDDMSYLYREFYESCSDSEYDAVENNLSTVIMVSTAKMTTRSMNCHKQRRAKKEVCIIRENGTDLKLFRQETESELLMDHDEMDEFEYEMYMSNYQYDYYEHDSDSDSMGKPWLEKVEDSSDPYRHYYDYDHDSMGDPWM